MESAIFILAFLTLLSGLTLALADYYNKKKIVLFVAYCIFFLGAATLFTQHFESKFNDAKIKLKDSLLLQNSIMLRQKSDSLKNLALALRDSTMVVNNKQDSLIRFQNNVLKIADNILNHSNGGKGNKPVLVFYIVPETSHGRFLVKYGLFNWGNYPLHGASLLLADLYTLQTDILEARGKYHIKDIDSTWELSFAEFQKHIEFGTIPANNSAYKYEGWLLSGTEKFVIAAQINWSDGYYELRYEVHLQKNGKFKVKKAEIKTSNGDVGDVDKFFPLVPDAYWKAYGINKLEINKLKIE